MRKQRAKKLPGFYLPKGIHRGIHEWMEFASFLSFYLRKKIMRTSRAFESKKNMLVKFFIIKRGRYNRPFLHLATMGVLLLGIVAGPYLADTYPVFAGSAFKLPQIRSASAEQQSIEVGADVFQTQESTKPRSTILTYTVERGDTISTIAQKFGISVDTIKWANDLTTDDVTVGDELKILPVTGIAHKVQSGDSIYSIAKTYGVDAQGIVDFPFNDFANPETFSLINGEMLIVPNGIKPSEKPRYEQERATQLAGGPMPAISGGYSFPTQGIITQNFSWYHTGVDIAGPVGTPIYAAHSGTIERVSVGTYDTGYGTNVWINDGDGVKTHYAHLSGVNVSAGQSVIGGRTIIGWRGNTGRSTGPHLHFEIQVNGIFTNPFGYVSP